MGFFDLFRKGKLYAGKKELPSIVAKFFFRGKEYILEEFDLDFKQDVADNNKPDGETYGGLITLTISAPPDSCLTAWMMNPVEKQHGEICFFSNEDKIREGALLQLSFKNAYCIGYQQVMNPQGSGLLTTIIISPYSLKIGKDEFVNKWKG